MSGSPAPAVARRAAGRTAGRPPRVLVTDAERGSALAIIRSLGRAGWDVVAAAADRHGPGLHSRYARHSIRYSRPEADPDAFAANLLATVRRFDIDLLVPVTDAVIVPVSRIRDRFEEVAVVALPDETALERARDKTATLALARSLGVPAPAWAPVRTVSEALEQAARIGFPLVLKPYLSRAIGPDGTIESYAVSYADDATRLAREMDRLEGRTTVLLQQYCPGEGVGIGVLADRGSVLLAFQHRRIHEVPTTGGASSLREGVPVDAVLLGHSEALLGALGWTGLALVEFKVGPHGPILMEINGRPWGSLPLAIGSGVDLAGAMAELFLHGRSGPSAGRRGHGARAYRCGVRYRDLGLEVAWIGSVLSGSRRYPFLPVPPRWAAIQAAIGLLDPRIRNDAWSRDDPRPGLVDLVRISRHVLRKVRHGTT